MSTFLTSVERFSAADVSNDTVSVEREISTRTNISVNGGAGYCGLILSSFDNMPYEIDNGSLSGLGPLFSDAVKIKNLD